MNSNEEEGRKCKQICKFLKGCVQFEEVSREIVKFFEEYNSFKLYEYSVVETDVELEVPEILEIDYIE